MNTLDYVLVDGKRPAQIKALFPVGSTSYGFPHARVDFLDGEAGVVVALKRLAAGAHGWPLVPSVAFPGELTLACPRCKSKNVTLSLIHGPGGRLGDPGGCETIACEDCGRSAWSQCR